jgi:hypothetical protein
MAKFKIRLVLNQGRQGAPLAKLGRISEQAERFLRSLAADCHVSSQSREWLAVNFKNGSVEYDAEFQRDVNPGDAQVFARNLEFLADSDAETEGLNGSVSARTAAEFGHFGTLIDPDEVIRLGIYPGRGGAPKWRDITYSKTANLRKEVETPLLTHGAVQGILYAWFKEAKEPNFQMRELATGATVRVIYPSALYFSVVNAVQERNAMLMVSGDVLYNRALRSVTELRAERIVPQQILSTAEFEALFGSIPEFVADFDDDDDEQAA